MRCRPCLLWSLALLACAAFLALDVLPRHEAERAQAAGARAAAQRAHASAQAEVARLQALAEERVQLLRESLEEEDALVLEVEALTAERAAAAAAAAQQQPTRVLACITVGYAFAEYATAERYAMLQRQLRSYAEACEAGYEVDVILVSNEGWDPTSAPIDLGATVCQRSGRSLSVRVERFPLRSLPPGTHGTHGDLAFQHRAIFAREAGRYDLYVCQEDDVALQGAHLAYFARAARAFEGTDYMPGFVTYEVAPWAESEEEALLPAANASAAPGEDPWRATAASPSAVILDWRLADACVLDDLGTQLAAAWSSSCCAYVLTAAQLARALREAPGGWLTALSHASTSGEFNPRFGSARWLHALWEVVVPLGELTRGALLWHSTNRYVRELQARMAGAGGGSAPPPPQSYGVGLNGLSLVEAVGVFGGCAGSPLAALQSAASAAVMARAVVRGAESCSAPCAQGVRHVRVEKERLFGRAPLQVEYQCLPSDQAHFPFVE